MAKDPVPTHLNAYYMELQEAQDEAVKANARVEKLKQQINEKRTEQGLKPDDFGDEDETTRKPGRPKKDAPEEASGFGGRTNHGGQN